MLNLRATIVPVDDPTLFRDSVAREQQVLVGAFEGLANKQIADRLQVSESSVKPRSSNCSRKQRSAGAANWSGLRSNNTGI